MDSSSAAAAFNEFAKALVGSMKYKPRTRKGEKIYASNEENTIFQKRCSPKSKGSALS